MCTPACFLRPRAHPLSIAPVGEPLGGGAIGGGSNRAQAKVQKSQGGAICARGVTLESKVYGSLFLGNSVTSVPLFALLQFIEWQYCRDVVVVIVADLL